MTAVRMYVNSGVVSARESRTAITRHAPPRSTRHTSSPVVTGRGLNVHVRTDDALAMQRLIRLCRSCSLTALAVAGLASSPARAHAGTIPVHATAAAARAAAAPARVVAVPPAAPRAAAVASAPRPAPPAEPAISTPGPIGDYLRAVHGRLHARWNQDFVKTVSATYRTDHPLNDPARRATLALTIRWDGSIAEATVKNSSGSTEFDAAALDVVRKSTPFPLPVAEVISDDSFAHVEWTFARDWHACAAGAQIARVDDPLEVALPRLLMSNRVGEALRRVGLATNDHGAALDRFARLYLSRTVPDPMLDVASAVALAEAGDRAQVPRLRAALGSRPTAELAAQGLRALGIDICDAIREPLRTGTIQAREIAISASRFVARAGADISACRPALATIVADPRQPTTIRLSALDTLVTFAPMVARPVVMAAIEDKDPSLRAAAVLASVRRGAGRPEMYRMAPLLHDKTVEIRAAASAGMVRAGGDLALEQLYLLGRETDARPGTWVAAELAQMSTPASAEFLGKMLKKDNPPVQLAAARALAARKDKSARTELEGVKSDERVPGEVRAIAAGTAAPAITHVAATATASASASSSPTEPVRALLKSNRDLEAAGWIVDHFSSLAPRDGIDVLGAWLVRAAVPGSSAAGAPSSAPPPATATATNVPAP
jgi:TonB family protein